LSNAYPIKSGMKQNALLPVLLSVRFEYTIRKERAVSVQWSKIVWWRNYVRSDLRSCISISCTLYSPG